MASSGLAWAIDAGDFFRTTTRFRLTDAMKAIKTAFLTGLLACVSVAAYAQSSSDDQGSQQAGFGASVPSSASAATGWGAHRAAQPGRMTEHGWQPPTDNDCSLNGTEISGSAGVRCMK
jgi:hypothetical protein